jgi:hypothetical protein
MIAAGSQRSREVCTTTTRGLPAISTRGRFPVTGGWLAILLIAIGIGGAVAGTFALSGGTIMLLGFVPVAAGIALWYAGES